MLPDPPENPVTLPEELLAVQVNVEVGTWDNTCMLVVCPSQYAGADGLK